jgi:anti-sigma regulatory factor (Ser/Thr protein kinase)
MDSPYHRLCRAVDACGRRWLHLSTTHVRQRATEIVRRLRTLTGAGQAVQDHRASWTLPEDLSSVPAGRRLIRAQLAEWDLDRQSDLAELLVSELVTNALRHAGGKPVLTLWFREGMLHCAVEDGNADLPPLHVPDVYDENGRGLQMVDLLSQFWGVEHTGTGKAVWFEVPVDQELGC